MEQSANQAFRFYSDLHMQKQNTRKQARITKFVRQAEPNDMDTDTHNPPPQNLNNSWSTSKPPFKFFRTFIEDEIQEFDGFLTKDKWVKSTLLMCVCARVRACVSVPINPC